MSTDLASKNLSHFSLLNDTFLFQKYEFFIQFFCKNRKNSIFREKIFGAENYRSKIAVIFFRIGVRSKNIRSGDFWNISNIARFSNFFSVLFMKRVAPLFFNPRARIACRAMPLFYLFQSPFLLKNKCGFPMRILKKI